MRKYELNDCNHDCYECMLYYSCGFSRNATKLFVRQLYFLFCLSSSFICHPLTRACFPCCQQSWIHNCNRFCIFDLSNHRQVAGQKAVTTSQRALGYVRSCRCLSTASELNALEAMIWQVHIVEAHCLLCGVVDWLWRLCLNGSCTSLWGRAPCSCSRMLNSSLKASTEFEFYNILVLSFEQSFLFVNNYNCLLWL